MFMPLEPTVYLLRALAVLADSWFFASGMKAPMGNGGLGSTLVSFYASRDDVKDVLTSLRGRMVLQVKYRLAPRKES